MVDILPQKTKEEYNEIFQEVLDSVKHDANASLHKRKALKLLEEGNDYVYVYDNIDSDARYYTLKNPATIDKKYIKDLCCFTPSLQELPYVPKETVLVNWLDKHLDKNMLMAVNGIVFMNDAFDEAFIKSWAEKRLHKEQVRRFKAKELPTNIYAGISWHKIGLVFVNCGALMKSIADDKDRFMFGERDSDTFESEFKVTLIHEIRHNAQDNLYLEDKYLHWVGKSKEQDAETYATQFVYHNFITVTKRNYKVKELENTMKTQLKRERLTNRLNKVNKLNKNSHNELSL